MLKGDLVKSLGIEKDKLEDILKSCSLSDVKNFNAIQINVIKSYMKKANICSYVESNEIEIIEYVRVPRKELIMLISKAYYQGIEDGINKLPIVSNEELKEIYLEAING